MTSETENPAGPKTYVLTCTDCAFTTTVEGSFLDALDRADSHQADNGEQPASHFVNLTLDGQS